MCGIQFSYKSEVKLRFMGDFISVVGVVGFAAAMLAMIRVLDKV